MTATFEVRVEGELSSPTLHRLGCAHCVAESQTLMRIEATTTELHRLLETCSEQGFSIESVVKVSRGRAPAPDVPPRHDD
jgi:hypothetical protein